MTLENCEKSATYSASGATALTTAAWRRSRRAATTGSSSLGARIMGVGLHWSESMTHEASCGSAATFERPESNEAMTAVSNAEGSTV